MIKRHILFLVIAILFSCKEYDKVDVDKIFKDSPTPELDMVFYELVKDFKNRIKVYHQILEKENNRYIIKEQDIIAMFNDFEMEFAKANYYDYIPYTGL